MAVISMKQLLDAGVHFGHQTRRWNPKMKRFIHGERNGIYIIDLNQTLNRLEDAYTYVRDLTANGGTIMFVGTKRQAQDSIQSYAEKCGMPYVNQRWLGGMLTNFQTISKRVAKMKEYQRMRDTGEFEAMPKKEALLINRELIKLERNLGGIRNLTKAPNAVFILDTKLEHTAVTEANKLGLPLVAVVDTNCDPDLVDYVIPGNDDAIRAGDLMCRVICDAVLEGHFIRAKKAEMAGVPAEAANAAPAAPEAPAERSAEEQAAHDAKQAEARDAAAAAAAEREARIAAEKDAAAEAKEAAKDAADAAPAEEAPAAEASAAEEAPAETPAPAAASADPVEIPDGAHAALEDGSMPEGFEIKGNAGSMKFHQPGGRWYDQTVAEIWFSTPEAATAGGYTEAGK